MTLLSLNNIRKSFGDNEILKGICLEVKEGEVLSIIGPSGSGKSTLLRCINRLEDYEGEIYFQEELMGKSPERLRELRAKLGMVFQNFNLFPHLTAYENCLLSLKLNKNLAQAEAQARVVENLRLVGLEAYQEARPEQLSGGQRQRVAIARALCLKPVLLLFDEPTSALDPELVTEVLQVMKDLARSGLTMIVVSHEMSFAQNVANRVIMMDKGLVVEEGSANQVFNHPQEARTKAFLQSIQRS